MLHAARAEVLRRLLRMGLSREDAEDAAQEVLLKCASPDTTIALLRTLARYEGWTTRKRAARTLRSSQRLRARLTLTSRRCYYAGSQQPDNVLNPADEPLLDNVAADFLAQCFPC